MTFYNKNTKNGKGNHLHEKIFQRNGIHYEIYCPQCTPFLPEEVAILDVFSEEECLDWFLENTKKEKEDDIDE